MDRCGVALLQIVEGHDFVARGHQHLSSDAPDVAGSAGHQNSHALSLRLSQALKLGISQLDNRGITPV